MISLDVPLEIAEDESGSAVSQHNCMIMSSDNNVQVVCIWLVHLSYR